MLKKSGTGTKDRDKVLIDASARIEFFRKKGPYYGLVMELLDNDKICCTGIVPAELLQLAKSEKELSRILKN